MLRIGILASTKGTDMQAIIDAINSKKLNAAISVVISNKEDSYALERAEKNNIKAVFIEAKGKEREAYDKEVAKELDKNKAGLVLLIGWLRILSPWFVRKYKNRIINIHPSLLPAFAGGMDMDVHQQVLERGCKVTGATLHFVDESVDHGHIIMQKAVEIAQDETAGTLKEKVQKAEQEIILKSLDLFAKGKIRVDRERKSMDKINSITAKIKNINKPQKEMLEVLKKEAKKNNFRILLNKEFIKAEK